MNIVLSLLWIFIFLVLTNANVKYKICVVMSNRGNDKTRDHCPPLSVDKSSQVECVFATDKLHCLRKILNGEADFGVFQAEEISYATQWNDYLSITNEIRLFENEKFDYNMVVLINEDAGIKNLNDLKGKRLCHPGFYKGEPGNGWSNLISQYFERIIVPQKCDPQLSLIENQLKSLSQFFDESCKPGQWDPDPDMDNILKEKYPNLCANCKNPSKCNINDQFWGRQGALQCLSDCFGDISWARLSDVRIHFKGDSTNACSKISFLCPDGTLQSMETPNPCIWVSRPWPAVITRNSTSLNIQRMINYVNTAKELKNATSWQWALNNLLLYYSEPISSNIIRSPKEYIFSAPGYIKAEEKGRLCKDRGYSMCIETITALKKCQALSDISISYGIQPKLNCILFPNCGKKLKDGEVDMMVLDADKIAFFKRNYGISKPILYATSLYHHLYRKMSAVMLTKNVAGDLQQLKGKKACFPSYDGYVWNSFLITLKLENIELFPNNNTIKNFFKESCAILSSNQNVIAECDFDDVLPEDSNKNGMWIETQTLRCIIEGGGDVAFINTLHINQYLDILRSPLNLPNNFDVHNFSTVCNRKNRISVDCPLSWSYFGHILAKPNISSISKNEMTSLLINMDMTFGRRSKLNNNLLPPVFSMYGPFDDFADPMFPADTEKLETIKQLKEHQTPIAPQYESYIHILNDLKPTVNSSVLIMPFSLLQLLIIFKLLFKYCI
ncbi:transferrin-like isoform X1 [Rhopalosiphum padi]|uniref:transferrin-like isoform X1 n=2 Tax=Rhopalosiphum padi TaxID=40932 RepID=UPI00298E4EBF|nr:transferrin-like isoform X1 [Rhopalosiphum padi]